MSERPTLQTERLILRPFDSDDAERVAALAGEREVAATTLHIPHPYLLQHAEAWISGQQAEFEAGRSVVFAITLREGGALAGAVGLVLEQDHNRAELGYWVGKPFWNRGYATEAARAVVRWALEGLGMNRVFAHHMANNPASGRVLVKAGMRCEGALRQHVLKWGAYQDCLVYGITRGDFGV